MQKIQGSDYLYRRGNRYVVRMQVPLALQSTVGRRELKKSLGADFGAARNDIHRVIADFQDHSRERDHRQARRYRCLP